MASTRSVLGVCFTLPTVWSKNMTLCSICKVNPVEARENAHLCPECERLMEEGITLSFPKGCTLIEEGALESPFLYRLEIPNTVLNHI